jgi:hypothetical protein
MPLTHHRLPSTLTVLKGKFLQKNKGGMRMRISAGLKTPIRCIGMAKKWTI